MEPNSSTSDEAFFEALRRHRAELHESMSALENASAAAARATTTRDRSARWTHGQQVT